MGHEYVADVEKHSSQTDAARGFGGKYGVERDRADKVGDDFVPPPYSLNCVGLATTQPKVLAHASQMKDGTAEAISAG